MITNLTEIYFFLKNNKLSLSQVCEKYNITYKEANALKRLIKQTQLTMSVKNDIIADLGHKDEAYFTEEEMLNGYKPCSYEELIKEYEDN